jgi:hypothetical protein
MQNNFDRIAKQMRGRHRLIWILSTAVIAYGAYIRLRGS